MKANTKECPQKPIHEEIQITIESEDELKYLWHVFNLHNQKILDACRNGGAVGLFSRDINSEPVFNVLDGLAVKYGLRADSKQSNMVKVTSVS